MSSNIKKSTEEKLEILKSIIDQRPFGFTLMEIYKNYKDQHGIGSRNTLKNYLDILLERDEIKKITIGNYKVFRSKNLTSMKDIFSQHPHFENMMIKLFAVISKALGDDLESKGETIGKEMALTAPIRDSKLFQRMIKNHPKNIPKSQRILFYEKFFQKIKNNQDSPFDEELDIVFKDNEATLIIKNSRLLAEGAWLYYYMQVGILKTMINEMMDQSASINVEVINEKECKIKFKLE
ncbi:MAG: hypothetical protein EAX96_00220 [Candidatus Lokiarchaeota archaeon]|nr:hypothetical protein [Candidatus Lokiarchaeota archaeon]